MSLHAETIFLLSTRCSPPRSLLLPLVLLRRLSSPSHPPPPPLLPPPPASLLPLYSSSYVWRRRITTTPGAVQASQLIPRQAIGCWGLSVTVGQAEESRGTICSGLVVMRTKTEGGGGRRKRARGGKSAGARVRKMRRRGEEVEVMDWRTHGISDGWGRGWGWGGIKPCLDQRRRSEDTFISFL